MALWLSLLLATLSVSHLNGVMSLPFIYNTSSGPVAGKLNVHLVPHSHDDVGWLKTIDQYYSGANNSIQNAAVHLILDTVISALADDPNRKFIFVEQVFFQRWWREQTQKKKKTVKKLVRMGQLEFINGGWCMHDEATTHYIDMIDQTTLGHKYIKEQFRKVPRTGWQIDPFGHSAVQGYLLGAELGFDGVFFARIDYQDKLKRLNESALEMIWQPSRTLGDSAQIFTGAFYDFYYPPSGFNFDMDSFDTPIQDDPFLFDFNVEERVNDFVAYAETQASHMRTNHIMWTLGGDFQYQNAHGWFKQLDKFINWVNKDGRVNAFYSTPSIYTDAKYAANETWPLKQGDFFPYADCPHCYWTGYFTSRPALKGYVRLLSNYFMMARQLEFFVGRNPNGPNTDALWEALAVSQHHDAVSGTEKQHTANDYALRLSIAYQEAEKLVNSAFGCLVQNVPKGICHSPKMQFFQCQLLNLSFCPLSESVDEMGGTLVVLVYNSLTWNRTEYIRIPVNSIHLQVMDSRGILVPSQLLPINSRLKELRRKYVKGYLGTSGGSTARYWLVFLATVPALGLNTYTISVSNEGSASASIIESMPKGSSATIRNNYLKMTLSESGLLSSIVKTGPEGNLSVESSYLYYEGNPGNDTKGADGAYLFRPIRNSASRLSISENISLITGPLVHEVWQEFSPWIHQVYRLYEGKDHVEVEYFIGPIPIDDGIGKDVIVRFSTSIDSNGVFFTDSNGRDFLKRVRDHRADWDLEVNEPVAGNYYPVNLGMYLNDDKNEFSVLVDRSVGGSSLANGQLELMLHRRLIHDDGRGVGEPLNETVCIESVCEGLIVQGKLYMQFNPSNKGSSWRRSMGQQVYSPLQLAFSSVSDGESWADNSFHSFSAMSTDYNLPENVALITLQELNTGQTLLRLAHLYEANEDDELSTKAYVDLKKMFPKRQLKSIVETSLSANQEISKMRGRLKWRVERPDETIQVVERGGPVDHQNLIVELTPMEIRTFLLKFTEVIAL